MRDTEAPLSGRRREAARNDVGILDAARSVFLEDPSAPVSAVAARAKVGISALYRRYPSKEDLLRELARDGLVRYIAELEAALADEGDPWTVYAGCLTRILDGGSQALAQRLAGTFTPTQDLSALARRAAALADEVHSRAQRQHALRADVSPVDIVLLLETLSAVTLPGADGGHALRRRYLALLLQALRAPGAGPLPAAPDPGELGGRWKGTRAPAAGAPGQDQGAGSR
ncbi:MAG TPA: TetR/AcrR family transcriptional regulator [Trebonia sp.]|jgi:AcrR family transcriptional regulator